MHRKLFLGAVLLVLLAACGKSSTTSTTATTVAAGAGASAFGSAGDAMKADRTIAVHIMSSLAYDPAAISVTPGETVVFKVSNDTSGIHEFVLGDSKVQSDYESMMMSMGTSPMSMPDHSNVLNLQPGATKQLAWTFPTTSGTTVIYGSHEPGDFGHGLQGTITVGAAGTTPTTMGGMTTTTGMGSMPGMGDTTTTGMGSMPGMGVTTTTSMH